MLGVLLCLLVFASTFVFSNNASGADTIKIGALDSLTGSMAPGEALIHQGVVLAAEWVNNRGGITVNGRKYRIELVSEDTKSTGEGMIAAADKLVKQYGTKFVVGGVMAEMNRAANSVTVPAGVLHVRHYINLAPEEIGSRAPLVFSESAGISEGMRVNFTFIKEKYPAARTLAAIWPADGGEPYREKYLVSIAKEFGLQVVYTGAFANDTGDFNPVVAKALRAKADLISILDGWPYHIGSIIRAARTFGYRGLLCCSNPGSDVANIIKLAGKDNAEGFFDAGWDIFDPQMPPIMKTIVEMGRTRYGNANHWHSFGFNTLFILVQAIESAQSLDPAVVARHWRTMESIDTVTGPGKMGGQKTFGLDNIICQPVGVVQVVKGRPQRVMWFGNKHTP